jgi:selenocysteine lyase/cysteine desulfurase
MKLLLDAGRDHIQERILMLTGRLRDALREMGFHVTTPEDASSRSGIMNFRVDRPQKVVEVLNSMGIIPCGARPDWARCSPIFRSTMRVAPHFYNTVEEIDAFVDSMREATR